MKKCEVSITATFAEDRINVEGRRDFTGSRNMDEVLNTCAGAISTVLDIFFRTLTEHAPETVRHGDEIKKIAALNVLFVALYNYLGEADTSAVDKGMDEILARLRDMAERKNGENGASVK